MKNITITHINKRQELPVRLKIALVCGAFSLTRGGAERCGVRIAQELAKRHEVHVYTAVPEVDVSDLGIIVHHVRPTRGLGSVVSELHFNILAAKLLSHESFDIVHSHNSILLSEDVHTNHCIYRARYLKGIHEGEGGTMRSLLRRIYPKHRLYLYFEGMKYRKFPPRIWAALSQKQASEAQDCYNFPTERITIVPNGFDPPVWSRDERLAIRKKTRAKLGLSEDAFVVLFIGNYFRQKGLGLLIDALTLLPSFIHLVILGRDVQKPFITRAKQRGVANRCHFVGYTTDVASYLANADIFALPSFYESFLIAALEAAGSGLPLILTRNVSSEFAQEGRNAQYVEPVAADLGDAIRTMSESPELRQAYGKESEQIAARFTWSNVVSRLERVYYQVIETRGISL